MYDVQDVSSTPRLNTSHGPSPGLDTIPEGDVIPDTRNSKKVPPPTLPKPNFPLIGMSLMVMMI